MKRDQPALLCVANYQAGVGYSWDFIEGLYARIADHLALHGIRTFVGFPAIHGPSRALAGSAAQAVILDASLETLASVRAVRDFIRSERVRVVYLTDRPRKHWAYQALRQAGARRIVLHDHTSGQRPRPQHVQWLARWLLSRVPGVNVDTVIGVSDYVARRQVEVGLVPPQRVFRVRNGVPVPAALPAEVPSAHSLFGVAPDRPIIGCACRATPEKGVAHLFRAFDRLRQDGRAGERRPVLVYMGDGPALPALQELHQTLETRDDIIVAGRRPNAAGILASTDLCVVPSVWHEACGLTVLEAMAAGRPLIATRVGGIPELVEHNVTGLLVPPADEDALATATSELLRDPARARRLGDAARRRVAERFTPEQQVPALTALIESGFGPPCHTMRASHPAAWSPREASGRGTGIHD